MSLKNTLAAAALAGATSTASAALIQMNVSGTLPSTLPSFTAGSALVPGAPVNLTIIFDNGVSDASPGSPSVGNYPAANTNFLLTSGGFSLSGNSGTTRVINSNPDTLFVSLNGINDVDASSGLGPLAISSVDLTQMGPGTVLSNDSLTAALTQSSLNGLSNKTYDILFTQGAVPVTINSVTVAPVPSPGAIALVAAGAALIATRRKRDEQEVSAPAPTQG